MLRQHADLGAISVMYLGDVSRLIYLGDLSRRLHADADVLELALLLVLQLEPGEQRLVAILGRCLSA